MTFFKAVCGEHGYESKLYTSEGAAASAGNRHYETVGGQHSITIVEIYVPDHALEIVSERKLSAIKKAHR